MNNKDLNDEYSKILDEYEIKAIEKFGRGLLKDSFGLYNKMLELIFEEQNKQKKRIHKGLPYHMIGVLYKIQNDDNNAIQNYLLAYIEDTLTVKQGEEYKADYAPAYYNLRGFAFDHKILNQIKEISRGKKEKQEIILDPNEIFFKLNIDVKKLSQYTTPDKLVFIGGDYFVNSENITIIEKHVKDLNYIPIIPYYLSRDPNDFSKLIIPKNMDYQFSISWLRKCNKAIFSVIHGGGHYFEIYDFYNKNKTPLLIVHKFLGEKGKVEKLSGMVKTLVLKDIEEYTDPENELRDIIKKYL